MLCNFIKLQNKHILFLMFRLSSLAKSTTKEKKVVKLRRINEYFKQIRFVTCSLQMEISQNHFSSRLKLFWHLTSLSRFDMAGWHHSAGYLKRALKTEKNPSPPSGRTAEPPHHLQQLQRQEAKACRGRAEQKPSTVPDQSGFPASGCGRRTIRDPTPGSWRSGKTLPLEMLRVKGHDIELKLSSVCSPHGVQQL